MSLSLAALSWMRSLDDCSRRSRALASIHPVAAILVTTGFLLSVMSFPRDAVGELAPLFLYPVVIMAVFGVPVRLVAKPLLVAAPFVALLGLFNPWLDGRTVTILGISFSAGWLSLGNLVIKSVLAVTAAVLLTAVVGLERLATGLRMLGVPQTFVLQMALTFRYVWVLAGEAAMLVTSYRLRSSGNGRIPLGDWGSLAGGLLLRTYDRAERLYAAMRLRGFDGEYVAGGERRLSRWDWFLLIGWFVFFATARFGNLSRRLGEWAIGMYVT